MLIAHSGVTQEGIFDFVRYLCPDKTRGWEELALSILGFIHSASNESRRNRSQLRNLISHVWRKAKKGEHLDIEMMLNSLDLATATDYAGLHDEATFVITARFFLIAARLLECVRDTIRLQREQLQAQRERDNPYAPNRLDQIWPGVCRYIDPVNTRKLGDLRETLNRGINSIGGIKQAKDKFYIGAGYYDLWRALNLTDQKENDLACDFFLYNAFLVVNEVSENRSFLERVYLELEQRNEVCFSHLPFKKMCQAANRMLTEAGLIEGPGIPTDLRRRQPSSDQRPVCFQGRQSSTGRRIATSIFATGLKMYGRLIGPNQIGFNQSCLAPLWLAGPLLAGVRDPLDYVEMLGGESYLENTNAGLLSLERLLTHEGRINRKDIVASNGGLYMKGPWFHWTRPLIGVSARDGDLVWWSKDFCHDLHKRSESLDKHQSYIDQLCTGEADETELRGLLYKWGRWATYPPLGWGAISHIFEVTDQGALELRYDQLRLVVKEAGGKLPEDGLSILDGLWRAGQAWKLREEMERQTVPTPFRALNQCAEQALRGKEIRTKPLAHWTREIRAAATEEPPLRPSLFYDYLCSILLILPATQACESDERAHVVGKLLLALRPHLRPLYEQDDPHYRKHIAALKTTTPLMIGPDAYRYVEDLGGGLHLFRCEGVEPEKRVFVLGENNALSLGAKYGKLASSAHHKDLISLRARGVSFEVERILPIDWATNDDPEGLVEALRALKNTMPRNLKETLCTDRDNKVRWLPTDDRVPLCPASIEKYLHKHCPDRAVRWMRKSGLLEKGAQQRTRVLNAVATGSLDGLSLVEAAAFGVLHYIAQDRNLSADQLSKALERAGCVIHIPKQLNYADVEDK